MLDYDVDYDVNSEIEKGDFLPPYFAVAQRALRMIQTDGIVIDELAGVLETDQVLTARI